VAVAKQQDMRTIIEKLIKFNIKCTIASPFVNKKLKGAANCGIIYHNHRFDQLLSIVTNNKEFELGGRQLLILPITEYLKLTERN
jgi:hypothetical protein